MKTRKALNIAREPGELYFSYYIFSFFFSKYSSILIYWVVVKEVNTKKIYLGFGWISGEVCEIPNVETHNARIEEASIKNDTQKRNDQLLSLGLEKSGLESMHPKINLVYTKVLHSSKFRLWMGRAKCKRYS